MDEIEFTSRGTPCSAWHLRADSAELTGPGGRPCVVMGHGFAATRDCGLLPFAERFAAAGADVLIFDYRGFGASGGRLRGHVSHLRHRQDYHAAVAKARSLPGVDPARVALWGSSYSGGHVVAVAARDPRIAAVISQGAAMDGAAALALMLRADAAQVARLTGHGLRDALGALVGRGPHRVAVVGLPGTGAVITAPGAESGYRKIAGPSFRNEMCARGILLIATNRPIRSAARLRCPALFVIAQRDNIVPPSAVRAAARRAAGPTEVLELPVGHFEIYLGEAFETSLSAQVDFLRARLSVAFSPA